MIEPQEFTCFEFHDSLNIQSCQLIPWLHHRVRKERNSYEKWDSPGFFPHVHLSRRFQIGSRSLTGYIQFDIDKDTYLDRYNSRGHFMKAILQIQNCSLVATSFSSHGIWGLLKIDEHHHSRNFKETALLTVAPLQKELLVELDIGVSIHPHAYRLIPFGMKYFTAEAS